VEEGAVKPIVPAFLLAASLASLPAASQGTPPAARDHSAANAVREAAGKDKRGLVERNMQLTEAEAKKFWPLYDQHQKELDSIVKRQNRAVLDYVNAGDSLNDATARRLAREVIEADTEEVRLRDKSLRKMLAAIPARKAVRYIQIENKLRSLNRFDVAETIPLVR
jgi:Spy/CpxP family protein refolding chaperone